MSYSTFPAGAASAPAQASAPSNYDLPPAYSPFPAAYNPPVPPPAGFVPSYQAGYPAAAGGYAYDQPAYSAPVQICQPAIENIIVVGGCPACRIGRVDDEFTCLGVCCAIVFFPLGILCCLALTEKRCKSCGAVFD